MWVVKMGNFKKWPKSATDEFTKMCEKDLNLHKYNTKEIKLDKIRLKKYNSPYKMGYNGFGGKVGPKSSQF